MHTTPFDTLMAESLEALGEPGMAPRLLGRLGQMLGSRKLVLFCPLPGDGDPLAAHQWGMPDDFLERYARLIQGNDAWSEALVLQHDAALARGGSLSQQLIPTSALKKTAFWADYLRPLGIDAMANSIVESSPDAGLHVLAMYNDLGQDEFTPAQFAHLRAVTPWVRSLMRAQRRLRQAERHGQALETTLNQLPLGLMHVSPQGAVRYLNGHARDWLGVEDECRVLLRHASGWHARQPLQLAQVHAALPPLLSACLTARTPVSARLHTLQNQAVVALATPLRGQAVAQFVLVPEALPHADAAMPVCSALYGLTPAEAALLPLLLQGMTPREMAETQGVKMPTVRTQLASLYAKTGTRGQAELAQRVLRVAALV
jgi:DNA-binding CsgD family transcriptional regulator/PAS domain-containing protein